MMSIMIYRHFILVFFLHSTTSSTPFTNSKLVYGTIFFALIHIPHFLQMCCKVVQPSALLVVFETLLSSAATIVDEEKGNPSWQACADFYITCILSCLPWGGSELIEVVFFFVFVAPLLG